MQTADLALPLLPHSEAQPVALTDPGLVKSQLRQLDSDLSAMLAQDPATWNLDAMEQGYRNLQASASPAVSAEIDRRLATLAGKRKLFQEVSSFIQLASATDQRDRALVQQASFSLPEQPMVQLGAPAPLPPNAARALPILPIQNPLSVQSGPGFIRTGNAANGMLAAAPNAAPNGVPTISGAGIVRRNPIQAPGAPTYLLTANDGRVLAALEAAGSVNLESLVGRSVGVTGPRAFEPRLRSDLIRVERAMPVTLKP